MATQGLYTSQVSRRLGGVGWGRLMVVVLGVVAVLMATTALFAPWAYYLGGHFHWAPAWAGVADFAGPDGEYRLFLWVRPFPQGTADASGYGFDRKWDAVYATGRSYFYEGDRRDG